MRLLDPAQRPEAEQLLVRALDATIRLEADPAALSARVSDAQRVAYALTELSHSGVAVANFALGQPSLDEVFLSLTGRPAEDQTDGDAATDPTAQEAPA